MKVASLFAGVGARLIASAATAQTNEELLKLHDSLNDMCRDGAGSKTGEACDSRELVGQMLRTKNICFGKLGKVVPCPPVVSVPEAGEAMPPRASNSQKEPCQKFAENEIIDTKGFLVEFDYAAEETTPARVRAVVLDKPICFTKDPGTRLRVLLLGLKHSVPLGRHYHINMRMEAGDSWSGSVRSITEDKSIPD